MTGSPKHRSAADSNATGTTRQLTQKQPSTLSEPPERVFLFPANLKYVDAFVRTRTPLTQAGWWKGPRARTMKPGLRPHGVPLTRLLNFFPVFLAISKAFPIFRNCL
jgi:hypothetical protein